ncbi:MAG TPA: CRISPR-associated protein Cas5 [Anaerolineae bacterium]
MRVLKVVAEGLTTSFRFPHFMQGIHPTFELPPPATIYGHVCSALGDWLDDPSGVQFAYHFTHQGEFDDVEHVHVLAPAGGKLPGTQHPKVLEGAVNPFKRKLLFKPKLVLYLNRPEWEAAFRSPRYTVVLGRSQDLFTYTSVNVIELQRASRVYFEHTLAPYQMTMNAASGYVLLMPRFLDYQRNRQPTFARYMLLTRRVFSSDFLYFGEQSHETEFWIDPTAPRANDVPLGLLFHSWTGEYDDNPHLA